MKLKSSGFVLASTAAMLLASGAMSTAVAAEQMKTKNLIHCKGVNACKGKSECGTKNACKGNNNCKGQGTLMMTAAECKKAGGTVEMEKKKK